MFDILAKVIQVVDFETNRALYDRPCSIVTLALHCTVCETRQFIGWKSPIFLTPFDGDPRSR